MSFKPANFLLTAEGVDLLPVAPLTVYETQQQEMKKRPSIVRTHAIHQAQTCHLKKNR